MIAGVVGLVVVWHMRESANRPLPGAPAMEASYSSTRREGSRLPYPRRSRDAGGFVPPSNVRRLPSDS